MPPLLPLRPLDAALGLTLAALLGLLGEGGAGLAAALLGVGAALQRGRVPGAAGTGEARPDAGRPEDAHERDLGALADLVEAMPSAVLLCDRAGRPVAASPRLRAILLPEAGLRGGRARRAALVSRLTETVWLSPPGVLADVCTDASPPMHADLARAEAAPLPVVLRAARTTGGDGWFVDVQERLGVPPAPDASSAAPAGALAPPPAGDAPSSGSRLAAPLHASPLAATLTRRRDGRFLDANDAFARLVMRPRAEIVGETALGLGMWTSVGEREEGLARLRPGDLHTLPLPGGGTRTVRVWYHPYVEAGEELLLAFVADDEVRARAERDLAAERDFTQTILDTSGQGIVVADGDDRLLYVNTAFSDLVGVPPELLIGQPVGDFVAPDCQESYNGELSRRREGQRGLYETCLLHRTGQRRSVLVTAIPHPVEGMSGSVALITDLSLIRQAYDEADRQRAFYEDIVQRLPVRLVLVDRQWRFRLANAAAIADPDLRAAALGRTFEEVAEETDMPGARLAQFQAARARVLETMQPVEWTENVLETGPQGKRDRAVSLQQRLEPLRDADGTLLGFLGTAIDITDRVRSAQAVEQQRAFYETLLGELPLPVAVFERDGRVLYLNPALAPRAATRAALLGEVLPPRLIRQLGIDGDGASRLDAAFRTGERQQWTERRAAPGGRTRHMLASLVPMLGPDGAVASVLGYTVDVTAQHEGQMAIERTKAYYETILRRLPVEVYTVRPDATFDFLNDAAVEDPALRTWLVGRRNADYAARQGLPPDLYAARDAWADDLVARPREDAREEEVRVPGQPVRHVLRVFSPVFRPGDGALDFLIGYGIDLTERVEADRRREAQRRFYEGILDRLPLDVLAFDPDGRFLYVAPGALAGIDPGAALGRRYADLAGVGGGDEARARAEAADAWIASALATGRTQTLEETTVAPDGAERDALHVAVPIRTADGDVEVVVAYTLDVTERKRHEASLLAAKTQAEQLARAKSTFLANMSHEVRTPLAGIIGFAEVLAEELGGAQQEAAQLIRQSGMRLLETLNSVLDFARLEADALDLTLSGVDLGAEATAAAALFRPLTASRGVVLTVDVPDQPVLVRADAPALHRVLVNLISNAVKFTDGGEVRVTVGGGAGAPHVRIADTGAGIDAAFLPHLFEEFRQESAGLARSHQGSGLGLSITRRLVDLMHGRIDVESVKGEGTVFTVHLVPASASGRPPSRRRA